MEKKINVFSVSYNRRGMTCKKSDVFDFDMIFSKEKQKILYKGIPFSLCSWYDIIKIS